MISDSDHSALNRLITAMPSSGSVMALNYGHSRASMSDDLGVNLRFPDQMIFTWEMWWTAG